MNQSRWSHPLAGIVLFLTGCAHLEHQTTKSEPHALLTVTKRVDLQIPGGKLKTLDGLPVSAGRTYRLRPGNHAVVTDIIATVVDTATPWSRTTVGFWQLEPAANGRPPELTEHNRSGSQLSDRMVMETRRVRSVTNSISVKAGGRYELVADQLFAR